MEIDCNINCPSLLKLFNSCPTKQLFDTDSIFSVNLNAIVNEYDEVFYVLLSTSPYLLSFCLFLIVVYYKTTRAFGIFIMSILENFVVELLKNSLRDPRPNFKCNRQFGNPSNHAVFFFGLCTWLIMEKLIIEKKFQFNNTLAKVLLFILTPFILVARYKLKYHTIEQLFNGCLVGLFICIIWFILFERNILREETQFNIFLSKFGLNNNMSDYDIFITDSLSSSSRIYQKYLHLTKKKDELEKMKQELKLFKDSIKDINILKEEDNNIDNEINQLNNIFNSEEPELNTIDYKTDAVGKRKIE
jgi:membrane-associated phospholipid phosphatase